ncbi:hypothetical protein [Hymenobacter sp. HDW8]|uniref:hypothetical protein n=1 Tax=Hymenobacter sp. HDW8 TaxID=2714932 RepID=UPI00140BF66F|nr:hypothetical protein [Hymenobacter sp. HDW8]QIL77406.1 hypothetical protein G7064_17305 [Hymenobacter sp. HDW8]
MRLSLLILLLVLGSCESDYRVCPATHTNPTNLLYNDVVIELIERRFYLSYLPDENVKEIERYFSGVNLLEPTRADSIWIGKQRVRFQRQLFQDTAQFQTFYLNTVWQGNPKLADLPGQFTAFRAGSRIATMLTTFAPHLEQAALDSLNGIQTRMQAAEFQLCTSKLLPARPRPYTRPLNIGGGVLTLSNVVFNKSQDQALLSYGWLCGPKCGFGEVLWVEKIQGRWRIKQAEGTWIS